MASMPSETTQSDRTLAFRVLGRPRPKGSARPIKTADGRVFMEAPANAIEWQNKVTQAALQRCETRGWKISETGAFALRVKYFFGRPKSHYGTGRNREVLKPSAPAYPISRAVGDIGKLTRAIEDALTGVVYRDDSQIVEEALAVLYAPPGAAESALILITEID